MNNIRLLNGCPTYVEFKGIKLEILYRNSIIKIFKNENNYSNISLKDQHVSYKARILGSYSLSEDKTGNLDYKKYFMIYWGDDQLIPELSFNKIPLKIWREYKKGHNIELGVEEISCYRIIYNDKVSADFIRKDAASYDFSFSTNFNGTIWKDPDGSHLIKFKGIRLDADKDGYNEESKFLISRSKYTDNLILILQDDASVYLET